MDCTKYKIGEVVWLIDDSRFGKVLRGSGERKLPVLFERVNRGVIIDGATFRCADNECINVQDICDNKSCATAYCGDTNHCIKVIPMQALEQLAAAELFEKAKQNRLAIRSSYARSIIIKTTAIVICFVFLSILMKYIL